MVVQPPARRLSRALAVLAVAGVGVLVGCSHASEAATTQQLAVCVSPTATSPAGTQVELEMRQGDSVVATGSVSVGGVFQAEVPIGTDIDVYADGELVGTGGGTHGNGAAGGGPTVYLSGPGCPSSPPG